MRHEESDFFHAVLVLLLAAALVVVWSIALSAAESGPQCVIVKGKVTCCWTTSAGTVCQ